MPLSNFQSHINTNFPFLTGKKLLVAISGGIDSVVLTHLCKNANLNIALAHCNFNLRGKESDADEAFILKLAEDLDVQVFIQNFDTHLFMETYKVSVQIAARELRYNWFEELAEQQPFDYILTAHHADDNLETVLINFIRGTGLEGLTGIPVVNEKIVRPLLAFSRETIEDFAAKNKLKWREDSSNTSDKYLRNKLRHHLVPILKDINPNILQNFKTTLSNLNDTADIVEESTNAVLKRAITTINKDHIAFKVSEFKKVNNPKAYLYEVFKVFGFTAWDDILNLLDAQAGKQVFSPQYRLIKDRDHLLLSEIKPKTKLEIQIQDREEQINTPLGTLNLTEADTVSKKEPQSIYVDKDKIKFPLKLRKKQEGDVFYPLGMQGKKKLSKYFKDEKLSLLEKENIWLLCSENNIVWVLNKRADNRFKVTEHTKQILKITLKNN